MENGTEYNTVGFNITIKNYSKTERYAGYWGYTLTLEEGYTYINCVVENGNPLLLPEEEADNDLIITFVNCKKDKEPLALGVNKRVEFNLSQYPRIQASENMLLLLLILGILLTYYSGRILGNNTNYSPTKKIHHFNY